MRPHLLWGEWALCRLCCRCKSRCVRVLFTRGLLQGRRPTTPFAGAPPLRPRQRVFTLWNPVVANACAFALGGLFIAVIGKSLPGYNCVHPGRDLQSLAGLVLPLCAFRRRRRVPALVAFSGAVITAHSGKGQCPGHPRVSKCDRIRGRLIHTAPALRLFRLRAPASGKRDVHGLCRCAGHP